MGGILKHKEDLIKIQLVVDLHGHFEVTFQLMSVSPVVSADNENGVIYRHPNGFSISIGHAFYVNTRGMLLPRSVSESVEILSTEKFGTDTNRRDFLRMVHTALTDFSKSKVFSFDPLGSVVMKGSIWTLI